MPDLERILQNTPGTISHQWFEAGAPVDPGTVTIKIDRADGTNLVPALTATNGTGTAARTFNLTTTHTALLDRLTVTWTSSTKGTLVSYLEVAGGFLFTIDAAEQELAASEISGVTAADIAEERVKVEQSLENECGVAFVPRYERERITGRRWQTLDLPLRWKKVRAVRDVIVGDTTYTAEQLADLVPAGSFVYYEQGWVASNVAYDIRIGYEHGYDFTPERVKQAALLLLKNWIVGGPIDDRATSISTDQTTSMLATPGMYGSAFGIPEVDAVVKRYRLTAGV